MTIDETLDHIAIPRPGGSDGLEWVAGFIAERLAAAGADVAWQSFQATPYGFQLVWTSALLLMIGYLAAVWSGRYRVALALVAVVPVILLLEFELLWSPVSGLLPALENNVIGTYGGRPGGPVLIFSAHYDTTTHFGDHLVWGRWGWGLGPATAVAFVLPLLGLWKRRRSRSSPQVVVRSLAVLVVIPFAAMAWFQALGPVVRTPSPGVVDNGGSVAALLTLADRLASRPTNVSTTVKVVFLAAEEERALGSWDYAKTLDPTMPLAIINLEAVGASEDIAYVSEDGFALKRYHSPPWLVELLAGTTSEVLGLSLPEQALPVGTLTDGRSFLAHGLPAITLRPLGEQPFPRRLHSWHDSRERVSIEALGRVVDLLEALVERVDANPSLIVTAPEVSPLRKTP